jgi:hypothetical protein
MSFLQENMEHSSVVALMSGPRPMPQYDETEGVGLPVSHCQSPHLLPKSLRTAIMLISWEIWKERNERVFNNKSSLPSVIMHKIREEGKNWILAGAKGLGELLG